MDLQVIRLPTNGRPILVEQQAQILYAEIDRACRLARNVKAQTRMLLNAFELQAYLYASFFLPRVSTSAELAPVITLLIIFVPHLILLSTLYNVPISPAISPLPSAKAFSHWRDQWP